jgi:hypothetical protein
MLAHHSLTPGRPGGGGVPLKVLDVAPPQPEIACDHRLVLSRPDQHVAWRDNQPPSDPLALIDRIRGAAGETGHTTPAGEVDARRREGNGSNQKTGTRP